MKNYKGKTIAVLMSGVLFLSSCGVLNAETQAQTKEVKQVSVTESQTTSTTQSTASTQSTQATTTVASTTKTSTSTSNVNKTLDWQNADREKITLSNASVTITKSGVYEISGSLSEGSLIVNVDKTVDEGVVYLVLNQVNISSNTGTPIHIMEAKDVVMILADGTVNNIKQGKISTNDANFPSAAIFSKADLFITGNGTLNVETAYNDAITSKDDLNIESGTLNIVAASDGLVGKDSLEVNGGIINLSVGKDGLKATNDTEQGQGYVEINGGTINVTKSDEGVEAMDIVINGGKITIVSSDDGMNVKYRTGTLAIHGGEIYITSKGDGVDSNGNILMTGGLLVIDTTTVSHDNTPVDADGTITVTGGQILDTNGNAIDYTRQMGPGGPGGFGGGFGGRGGQRGGFRP